MTDKHTRNFVSQVPQLDLSEGPDMLTDFSREAQRHLISARNSLLVLETVQTDKEAIENIFKTFHTIKGLADFLKLHDICHLTCEAEQVMDMARKGLYVPDDGVIELIAKTVNQLQKQLELLDEQIANHGTLVSSYPDISELVGLLKGFIDERSVQPQSVKVQPRAIPTINFDRDDSLAASLEGILSATREEKVPLEKASLKRLLDDFRETSNALKVSQSKLHERQRELIHERELAIKLTQQAQSEARGKSEYLANMSHEIRTLINAILGFTDLLREGSLNDRQREHLNTIILSGKMLLDIVNDILDYSKVEAGKLKLENVEFNFVHIIEDVFKIIRTRLQGKPINLYFQVADDVPVFLLGDPTRLKQVFINLIDNAIKFTESGEIGLEISRDRSAHSLDGKCAILGVVRDTGIGIPDDRRKAIFESFTQANDSTTRIYGGTGLGLTLCKTFVEKMGGKIWVDSVLGQGSQFNFSIRLEEAAGKQVPGIPSELAGLAGVEVMIVDASQRSASGLSAACISLGMKIIGTAQGAKQGSEFLIRREEEKKNLPGIIFIDALLSDKMGYMLAYKIRQQDRYRSIKLVAMSSDMKADGDEDFVQAGFNVFLPKPIIQGELQDALRRLLGTRTSSERVIRQDSLAKISCEGIRVLVAEDSLPNQELLKVHFESLGCVCDYAGNGQEAIELLKKNSYNLCFMDLQMPVIGGVEAVKIIRTQLKNVQMPIIALTGAEMQDERERCLSAGMNDYLAKPFGLAQLKEKIVRYTKM